jgi:hypothetical protein
MRGQLTNIEDICRFAFGGDATFTLQSVKTNKHFTYKIEKADRGNIMFVSVMCGPENNDRHSYRYFGFFKGPEFIYGKDKAKVAQNAESVVAFEWFWRNVNRNRLPETVRFWHEGRCGCCHKKLTTPESISTGIGPVCAEKRGGRMVRPFMAENLGLRVVGGREA